MRNIKIAIIALLAAIVYILSTTVSKYFSFPILPYLKFDLAEIIVLLSLFLFGPYVAIILSILHFILLHFPYTEFPIIGPGLKLLAELTTVFSAYLAFKFTKSNSLNIRLIYAVISALIIRNAVMTFANYLILTTIFSGFINYLYSTIPKITGLSAATFEGQLILILLFTSVYNTLHVFITLLPAFWLSTIPSMPQLVAPINKHWLYSLINKNGSGARKN